MAAERRHIVVRGRVQGVWFRDSARDRANELGLAGWVRNCADGTVEIEVEGDRADIESFVEWSESGPPRASVMDVAVSAIDAEGDTGFEVRATRR